MKLLKFSADWCQPCKALSKELDKINFNELDITLVEFNLETDKEVFQQYGIRSVPTLMLVTEGDEVWKTVTGFKSVDFLVDWLA